MIFAAVDWNPLIVGVAASLPALLALGLAWVQLQHKLREMELTGLKTLHHVNSGTVIAARNLEVVSRQLAKADPSVENEAAHKAAILDVSRAIIVQNETADLIRSMGGVDTPAIIIPDEPIEVVLTTPEIKGTKDQLVTKQDLKDALGDK